MSKEVKLFAGVLIVIFLLATVGCAGIHFGIPAKASFYPAELDMTVEAVSKAEMSAGAKYCPEKIAQAKALGKEGVELYWACRDEEAMDKLAEARELAREAEMCQPPPPKDSDGDGVPDDRDECPGTPKGVKVDARGCPLDTDGDGVPDYLDKCPGTPKGVKVDPVGCPLDTDKDGVPDYLDKCPGTPFDAKVDNRGCWIIKDVLFDFDKWVIKPEVYPILDEVVAVLKRNPSVSVEIQGHTDSVGAPAYNQKLSEKRANAVMQYLVKKGIGKGRLSAVGYGLTKPIASNATDEGRARNRRVELAPVR